MVAAVGVRFSGASWCRRRARTLCGNSAWTHTTGCVKTCQAWCVGGCWIVVTVRTKPCVCRGGCVGVWTVVVVAYCTRCESANALFSFCVEPSGPKAGELKRCNAQPILLSWVLSWWLRRGPVSVQRSTNGVSAETRLQLEQLARQKERKKRKERVRVCFYMRSRGQLEGGGWMYRPRMKPSFQLCRLEPFAR